ncbi:MAG: hypothetical protein ACXVB5_09555, partial [Isosphaeraceae bacterium]
PSTSLDQNEHAFNFVGDVKFNQNAGIAFRDRFSLLNSNFIGRYESRCFAPGVTSLCRRFSH